ncbi:MAG: hypothetical protein ACKOC8_09790 [Pirellulales bacterium]
MATSRVDASSVAQIRSLLTAAENKVLQSSVGAALAKATKEQLAAAMVRARGLRDKWRDLLASQSRQTKRSAAGKTANARTQTKHDAFADAVKRLEKRLAELGAGVGGSVKQAGRISAAAKPTKRARTAAARGSRAGVRSELAQAVADMNRPRSAAGATKPAAVAQASKKSAKAAPVAAVAVAKAKGKNVKKLLAPATRAAQRQLSFDTAGQRRAKTAGKKARIHLKGITTRRGGHVLASTKRAQARRDGRSR